MNLVFRSYYCSTDYRHGIVFKLSSSVAVFLFAQVQPKASPPLPKALQKLHLEVSRQLAVSAEKVRSTPSLELRYDHFFYLRGTGDVEVVKNSPKLYSLCISNTTMFYI